MSETPAKGGVSGRTILLILAGVAVGIALLLWAGLSVMRDIADGMADARAAAAAEREEQERHTPSVFDVEIGEAAGRHQRIEGVVRNNGPETILFVEVRCALVDRSTDLEHDARTTYAVAQEGLPPGNRRSFAVYLDRPPGDGIGYWARCEIVDYRK